MIKQVFDRTIDAIETIAKKFGGNVNKNTGNRKADALEQIAIGMGGRIAKQDASTAVDVAGLKGDFNALLLKLKEAGIMSGDEWMLGVKAATNLPIEDTKDNSSHATITYEENVITITLDCSVDQLKDSDHGSTWGVHKWIGFGVDTGLESVVGVVFDDGTSAVTLTSDDASEATSVGLSSGDFVLYIKAEKIRAQGGQFALSGLGMNREVVQMRIVEP